MDIKEFSNLLNDYCKKINIELTDENVENFYKYMQLLLEWNEKINLTAIIDPKEVILKHFVDSLTICKYVEKNASIADVGTGAGFPGIPLKIVRPDLKIVLVDSLNKRVNFLNEVIQELQLENIKTVHSRVEDFGQNKEYRGKFDYSTARAVANLSTLSEYLIPLVKIGGKVIFMKGNNVDKELEDSKRAVSVLGGKFWKLYNFYLPDSDIERNVVIVEKIKETPKKFPRKAGTPSKDPIQ